MYAIEAPMADESMISMIADWQQKHARPLVDYSRADRNKTPYLKHNDTQPRPEKCIVIQQGLARWHVWVIPDCSFTH
jgi:hypothetical protein